MQKKHFTVFAKNGNYYDWKFTENIGTDDYGNKTYIHVEMPSGDVTLIDCRYMTDYNFASTSVKALTDYYGKNLVTLYDHDIYNLLRYKAFTRKSKEPHEWIFIQPKQDPNFLICSGPDRSLFDVKPSRVSNFSDLTLYCKDFLANHYGPDFVCAVITAI